MGVGQKVGQIFTSVNNSAKSTFGFVVNWTLKLATTFFIGLTLALIGQELMAYGTLSFVFVMTVTIGILWKIIGKWTTMSVLIFDLICILVALLLRMYIMIAP